MSGLECRALLMDSCAGVGASGNTEEALDSNVARGADHEVSQSSLLTWLQESYFLVHQRRHSTWTWSANVDMPRRHVGVPNPCDEAKKNSHGTSPRTAWVTQPPNVLPTQPNLRKFRQFFLCRIASGTLKQLTTLSRPFNKAHTMVLASSLCAIFGFSRRAGTSRRCPAGTHTHRYCKVEKFFTMSTASAVQAQEHTVWFSFLTAIDFRNIFRVRRGSLDFQKVRGLLAPVRLGEVGPGGASCIKSAKSCRTPRLSHQGQWAALVAFLGAVG